MEQTNEYTVKKLRSGLHWILFGLMFLLLDYIVVKDDVSFDFIPDFIGWILILVGLLKMNSCQRKRVLIVPVAVVLLIVEIVNTVIALKDPRNGIGELDYFFGLISILFDGLFLAFLQDIAKDYQKMKRASSIRKVTVFYQTIRVLDYATNAGKIDIEPWLFFLIVCTALGMLLFLHQIRALRRELRPGKTANAQNPVANAAISILLVLSVIAGPVLKTEADIILSDDERGSSYLARMDASQYNIEWTERETEYVLNDDGEEIAYFLYELGVARIKGTDEYVGAIRTIMGSPRKGAKTKSGKKEYGLKEYLFVRADVPMLHDCIPKNTPIGSTQETYFINVYMRKMLGVGWRSTYLSPYVDVTNWSRFDENVYAVEYDYTPNLLNPFGDNQFLTSECWEYGEFRFSAEGDEVTIPVEFEVRFGVAGDEDRSPWSIKRGKLYTKTINKTFTFRIDKD